MAADGAVVVHIGEKREEEAGLANGKLNALEELRADAEQFKRSHRHAGGAAE